MATVQIPEDVARIDAVAVELNDEASDVLEYQVRGHEESFDVDPELEAVLLESIAHGERGEHISAEELLREMRSRE